MLKADDLAQLINNSILLQRTSCSPLQLLSLLSQEALSQQDYISSAYSKKLLAKGLLKRHKTSSIMGRTDVAFRAQYL